METSIIKAIKPSIGYLIVVYMCMVCGEMLNSDSIIIIPSTYNFIFFLALVPFYMHRVILYEGEMASNNDELKRNLKAAAQLPSIISMVMAILIIFFLPKTENEIDLQKLACIAIATVPYYIQTFIAHKKYKENSNGSYFNFSYYIFFPALATCIIPFIIGNSHCNDILFVSIISISIALYFLLFHYTKLAIIHKGAFALYILLIIVVSFLSYNKSDVLYLDKLQVLVITITMTLIMGITESWWFIKDNKTTEKYPNETKVFYAKYVDYATAFFPFILVLGFMFPITNSNYLILVIYSLSLFFLWFKYEDNIAANHWRILRIVLGLLVPLFCVIAINVNSPILIDVFKFANVENVNKLFTIAAILFGGASVLALLHKELKVEKMLKIAIQTSILSILIILFLEAFSPAESDFLKRILAIKFIYILIFLIPSIFLGAKLLLLSFNDENQEEDEQNDNIVTFKNAVFIAGRPKPSLIAFLFTFISFISIGKISLLDAVLTSIPIYLITSFGFLINDVYDFKKDLEGNDLTKALVVRQTTLKAMYLSMVLILVLLIGMLLYLNDNTVNLYSSCILLGVILYSPFAKHVSSLKGLFTAILCISPILYSSAYLDVPISVWLLTTIMIYIFGREIVLDVFDLKADENSNYITIPSIIGIDASIIFSVFLMSISIVWIIYNVQFEILPLILVTVIATLHIWTMLSAWRRNEKYFALASQLSMIFSITLYFI